MVMVRFYPEPKLWNHVHIWPNQCWLTTLETLVKKWTSMTPIGVGSYPRGRGLNPHRFHHLLTRCLSNLLSTLNMIYIRIIHQVIIISITPAQMRPIYGVQGITPLGAYPRIMYPPQEYIQGLIYLLIKPIIIMICTIVLFTINLTADIRVNIRRIYFFISCL